MQSLVVNGTVIGFYDCRLNYSSVAVFSESNPSSLAASIVGIVILLITVAYVWLVIKTRL